MVFIIQSSSNAKEGVISKAQLAQRVRREHEKLERPSKQPRITPSHQPPQLTIGTCVGPSSVQIGPTNFSVGSSFTDMFQSEQPQGCSTVIANNMVESIMIQPERSSTEKEMTSYVPASPLV